MFNRQALQRTLAVTIIPEKFWNFAIYLLGVNLTALAGTGIFSLYFYYDINGNWEAGSASKYFLIQLDLSNENVLATWYSSVLLLLIALLAGLCFLAEQELKPIKRFPALHYGWLIYVVIFGLLSLDEVGSLHERLGMLSSLNPLGNYPLGWVYMLTPLILTISIFMFLFSCFYLRDSKFSLLYMIVGILLFMSIPLQEQLEVMSWEKVASKDLMQRPILFLLLEEGAEIFGAFMFLISTISYLNKLVNQDSLNTPRRSVLKLQFTPKTLIYSFLSLSISLGGAMCFTKQEWFRQLDGDRGLPQNWFPGMLAILSTILLLHCLSTHPSALRVKYRLEQFLAIFSLFLSAYYGAGLKLWFTVPQIRSHSLDDLIYASILLVGTALGTYFFVLSTQWFEKMVWLIWVVVLDLSIFVGDPLQVNLWDFTAMAVLLLAVGVHFHFLIVLDK